MSECYEGVVFRAAERTAREVFRSSTASFPARLFALNEDVFGADRDVGRLVPFDTPALHRFTASISDVAGAALGVTYDNRCGIRISVLFRAGVPSLTFTEADEEWVPLDESGMPIEHGPTFRTDELTEDEEYHCIRDAIRLGLEALGESPQVSGDDLKDAFCYSRRPVLESRA